MKKAVVFIFLIAVACAFVSGCSGGDANQNNDDYSAAVGDCPELAVSPSEEYIKECLERSELVLETEAVTESHDPNGKLNQVGGYVSCVYFSSSMVDQSDFSEKSVVDKGTSCGGCIEVYSKETDAVARNEYLSKFDGGVLDSGLHTVIGTIVIRISEKLDEEQQSELAQSLILIITSSQSQTDHSDQDNEEVTSNSKDELTTTITEETTKVTTATTQTTTKATTKTTIKPTTKPTAAPSTAATTEPPHVHRFSDATCNEPKTCSCGATEGSANGHNWKNATYTSPKTCSDCGATEGNPLDVPGKENYHGHVYTGGDKSVKFHYEADCAGKKSHEITWADVERRGLDPCGTCVLK